MNFDSFVREARPRLLAGLVAAFGTEVGAEATAEALAYAWENWERLSLMANPAGYLFRVGQTAARRSRRRHGHLPTPTPVELPDFEPRLLPSLDLLTEAQRTSVLLVHAFGWSQTETAALLGVDPSTVRTHLSRGVAKLQKALEVEPYV